MWKQHITRFQVIMNLVEVRRKRKKCQKISRAAPIEGKGFITLQAIAIYRENKISGNSGTLVLRKAAAGLCTLQCLKRILATLETEP